MRKTYQRPNIIVRTLQIQNELLGVSGLSGFGGNGGDSPGGMSADAKSFGDWDFDFFTEEARSVRGMMWMDEYTSETTKPYASSYELWGDM
ncbi:MAG: hypothetical protein J6N73_09030 [Prevotella sp.]|nr:hypothetical protein [Prevotella sp.]